MNWSRGLLTVLGLCLAVIAGGCGQAPEEAVEATGKVPITCASDDARVAYLTGRELQENLRATDSRQHFQRREHGIVVGGVHRLAHGLQAYLHRWSRL